MADGFESIDVCVRVCASANTFTDVLLKFRFYLFFASDRFFFFFRNHYCKKASHMRIASSLCVRMMTIVIIGMMQVSNALVIS